MSVAAVDIASPHDCLDGLLDVSDRLVHDFGLTIEWESLGDRNGILRSQSRTIVLNSDAPIDDQLWQLIQFWSYLAIGPHATPAAHIIRGLYLVPG